MLVEISNFELFYMDMITDKNRSQDNGTLNKRIKGLRSVLELL